MRLNKLRRGVFFRDLRLIKLLLRHVTIGGQRTKPFQRARRQIVVFLCAFCLVDCDCRVRPGDTQISRSLLKGQAIGQRIDLEKKATLGDAQILDDRKLDNTAADSGRDVDDIGIDRAVARCRVGVAFVQRIKRERDGEGTMTAIEITRPRSLGLVLPAASIFSVRTRRARPEAP